MENNQGLDFSNVSIEKILSGVEQPAPPQEPSVEQTDEKEASSKEETEQIPVTETPPQEEETSMEEETEVVQEEAEEQESIFSEVNSLMGMDIDVSGFPETVEGFANYAKELSNNLADQTIAQIFNAYPDVQAYLDLRMQGGNAQQFLKQHIESDNFESMEVSEENESQWINIVTQAYQEMGMNSDDIREQVEELRDTGMLQRNAERSLKYLKNKKATELENFKAQEAKRHEEEKQKIQQQWDEIGNIVSNGNVKGMVIPNSERNKFYNWMSMPDEQGKSEAMKARETMDTETAIAIEYMLYKGFDFASLAKNISKTNKAQELRSRLKTNNSSSKRMSSKKGFNPKSKNFSSIGDILKS